MKNELNEYLAWRGTETRVAADLGVSLETVDRWRNGKAKIGAGSARFIGVLHALLVCFRYFPPTMSLLDMIGVIAETFVEAQKGNHNQL